MAPGVLFGWPGLGHGYFAIAAGSPAPATRRSPLSRFFLVFPLQCERMFSYDEVSKMPGELGLLLQGYSGRYVG